MVSINAPRKLKKKKKSPVILVDRRAFLSAIQLSSVILQSIGEELEMFRASKHMDPNIRKALIDVASAHLHNLTNLSHALSCCSEDPTAITGVILEAFN